jgi:hypothetical protein
VFRIAAISPLFPWVPSFTGAAYAGVNARKRVDKKAEIMRIALSPLIFSAMPPCLYPYRLACSFAL